jgi:Uma2 family endonuclease
VVFFKQLQHVLICFLGFCGLQMHLPHGNLTVMSVSQSSIENLYDRLLNLPENLVGEIINGQLHTQPRPAGPHAIACSSLGMEIGMPYQKGRGGPGGWWIIDEPEIHFVRDIEVLVPDLAGWRRERLPHIPADQRFEVVPDWVCEVLSPTTVKKDRVRKMPIYARYGVNYLWLVDPIARMLEIFELREGKWIVGRMFKDQDQVSAMPFTEMVLSLAELWVEG